MDCYPYSSDLVIWVGFGAAMRFKVHSHKNDVAYVDLVFHLSTKQCKTNLCAMCILYYIEYYISTILPLLLIPSWVFAIDPFLILPGPGPSSEGRGGSESPAHGAGAWTRARQDQQGINSKGPRRNELQGQYN